MEYILENEFLKVTVTTWGAQVKSVVRKEDGVEHMWQADKDVWGYHAPILFPFCGRLPGGQLIAKGKTYDCPTQHGFARTMEHDFVFQNKHTLVLQLTDTPETLAVWPWKFRLMSAFTLEGDVLHHTLTVENQDEEEMFPSMTSIPTRIMNSASTRWNPPSAWALPPRVWSTARSTTWARTLIPFL